MVGLSKNQLEGSDQIQFLKIRFRSIMYLMDEWKIAPITLAIPQGK